MPALQCLLTGLLSALAAGTLAALLGGNGWKWAAGVGSLALLAAWLSYRGDWNSRLERLLGLDLNRDGVIGAPEPEPAAQPVRIELIGDEGRKGDFIDLPASPEKLKALASGIINHQRQFALSFWVGSGQLFSRGEFEGLRAAMLARGLAKWKREGAVNQGVELTPQGRAVLRYLASADYPHPTRQGRD